MAMAMAAGLQRPMLLLLQHHDCRRSAPGAHGTRTGGNSGGGALAARRRGFSLRVVPKAAGAGARAFSTTGVETSKSSPSSPDGKKIVPDEEINITRTSFGTIGLTVGISLLSYGFGAYFTVLPGSEISALMLTYGFPLTIIGMALKYAELKPVPNLIYADAFALRKSQATEILTQVRNDVTRFRYGDEQHLDEALKRIFRYGQAGGIQRRSAPKLQSIREEVSGDNQYSLVLVFEAKALKLDDFKARQAKWTSFFGPGVTANISTGSGANIIEVALVADGGSQSSSG